MTGFPSFHSPLRSRRAMAAASVSISICSSSAPLSSVFRPGRRSFPLRRACCRCGLSSPASSSPQYSRSHGDGAPNAPRSAAAHDGAYLDAEVDPGSNALLHPAPTTESTIERVSDAVSVHPCFILVDWGIYNLVRDFAFSWITDLWTTRVQKKSQSDRDQGTLLHLLWEYDFSFNL